MKQRKPCLANGRNLSSSFRLETIIYTSPNDEAVKIHFSNGDRGTGIFCSNSTLSNHLQRFKPGQDHLLDLSTGKIESLESRS